VLPLLWQKKEVASHVTSAPSRSASAGPSRAIGDVDIVVAGDLVATGDVPPRHKEALVCLVDYVRIRVAAVVHVPIRKAQKNNLAVRVVTVILPFPKLYAQWVFRSDFPNDINPADTLASGKRSGCKDP
jgi:hypothetical protein